MDENGGKNGPDTLWNLNRMNSGHVTMIIKKALQRDKLAVILHQSGELAVSVSPNDRNGIMSPQIRVDRKRAYFLAGMEIDLNDGGIGETGHDRVVGRLVGERSGRGREAESGSDGANERMIGPNWSHVQRMDCADGNHESWG